MTEPLDISREAKRLNISAPSMLILWSVLRERQPDENLFDSAERLLLFQALAECVGVQGKAAELLGITKRVMNYKCERLGWRIKDLKNAEATRCRFQG